MSMIHYGNTDLRIEDLLHSDVDLASPPEVFARLRRLLDEPDTTTNMLAEVIEKDPALSARVLKLANSAFYALPLPVNTIAEAVSLIGIREIQHIVLATEVIQRFDNIPEDLVDMYSFWRESLRCAVIARQLANFLPEPETSDTLFLAGLMHGIGHLVIYTRVPELGRKALLEHRHRGIPLHIAEREVMGFDYAQVGASLARQWELPPLLCELIAHHLEPQSAVEFTRETILVSAAHTLSQAGSFDAPAIEPLLTTTAPLLQDLAISNETLKTILPEAEKAFGASLALLH